MQEGNTIQSSGTGHRMSDAGQDPSLLPPGYREAFGVYPDNGVSAIVKF